ncbi:uncharacterized protein CANTADRAFT_4605 [Suhomyces tanzawaensis NRRL Y-17324]|uniref:DUF2415 domain-containing protein n=1 Tax=Suhomyces tanzawaensis NRRL Y-17324 TaxID=984487 RepID=A0A1E4SM41_9ASCO|nr:uncharacterized protein CANTADRAFT_4605 [Suhomyces tanzawaensis NRRL Y-17324]ODV80581.1 hypothetical protein CANTADRAFT_4605 [Suhomyces tanzawaensis NRRL Y-17324]
MTIPQSAPPVSKKPGRLVSPDPSNRFKNDSYHQCFQKYFHSYHYLKPDPVYVANVKAAINHWQLRDLIKYDPLANAVLYTRHDAIHRLPLGARGHAQALAPYVGLSYLPRCFDHSDDGLVVCGGLLTSSEAFSSSTVEVLRPPASIHQPASSIPKKGLFSFANPAAGATKTVRFGDMINNDVAIYRDSNSHCVSYVCNNDSNLYCLDIASNDSISISNKITCETNTCLNTVERNPLNHKLLAVTGDSLAIFLVDPTSGSSKIKTIRTGHNAGFGTAFHPNGNLFSSVFEDGTCLLYDLRNIRDNQPLMAIKLTRPGHQLGAFRVSKFSPQNDMSDLLVILEHVGRVHLVDLRRLNAANVHEHQVIVVPFALDQYAECKAAAEGPAGDETSSHADRHNPRQPTRLVDVYSDRLDPANSLSFTAPLVYDYDYLVNQNPQLFKEYFYSPPPAPAASADSPLKFHIPEWSGVGDSSLAAGPAGVSPTTSQRPSFSSLDSNPGYDDMNPDIDAHLQYVYDHMDYNPPADRPATALAAAAARPRHSSGSGYGHYSSYCEDLYQQSINHIHGEMELAGVAFCNPQRQSDSKVLIGCQDAGVLMFDVNGVARRSFGTFEYM